MSRKAIDAATEITVAWLQAVGSGGSKGYYAANLTKEQVAELFEAVYKKAKEIGKLG